jgi:hypothetical protein
MDLTLHPPFGAAFYVHIDGTIRLRFDSSQKDKILPWAHEWVRVIEHYLKRSPGGALAITDMPRNLNEINALVAKLNAQLAAERAEAEPAPTSPAIMAEMLAVAAERNAELAKQIQCPTCLGMAKEPDEAVCSTCNGTGMVNAG